MSQLDDQVLRGDVNARIMARNARVEPGLGDAGGIDWNSLVQNAVSGSISILKQVTFPTGMQTVSSPYGTSTARESAVLPLPGSIGSTFGSIGIGTVLLIGLGILVLARR